MLFIIIPAYNEKSMIEKAYSTIDLLLNKHEISHKFVFVDDGSRDKTWDKIEALASENGNVTGVCFSKNFEKEARRFTRDWRKLPGVPVALLLIAICSTHPKK